VLQVPVHGGVEGRLQPYDLVGRSLNFIHDFD
jgi:hypothetical protein